MVYETNDLFAHHFAATGKTTPPRYLNVRFDAEGRFLPMPGNTVVAHVVPGSKTEVALKRVRQALVDLPFGDRFAYTPVSSYHMTVFQGVIEDRRKPDYWPRGIALDAPLDETARLFLDRLAAMPPAPSFRMKIVSVTPLGLVLTGATPEDERCVRTLRDTLAALFGYRHPDHDDYVFHITLAYLKDWLPTDAGPAYLSGLAEIGRAFAAEIETLELAAPAFCEFPDMSEFRPLAFLS